VTANFVCSCIDFQANKNSQSSQKTCTYVRSVDEVRLAAIDGLLVAPRFQPSTTANAEFKTTSRFVDLLTSKFRYWLA
jgi:hypothetical protein